MPRGLLAVMTLAVFGQLIRAAVALLVGLRLGTPIGDWLCLHTSHEMSSFPMRGYPLTAAVKPACRGASRALGRPTVVSHRARATRHQRGLGPDRTPGPAEKGPLGTLGRENCRSRRHGRFLRGGGGTLPPRASWTSRRRRSRPERRTR